ncbi:V-set and immunoglobulin domain-containing protein 10-like 2 [Bagarius yarrelli]|nr:V-set and immunoglobulin domain-containing protein 10-like 2 [Bagarius yarrelli]
MFTLAVQFALIAAFALSGTSGQSVHTDSDRSGYVGTQVELRCHFSNSKPPVKISQVTWQKSFNGTKQNVAIANPALGVSVLPAFKDRVRFKNPAVRLKSTSLEDTTIVFNNLKLSDEATYICEYPPPANHHLSPTATTYTRPMVQMSLSTPTVVAGSKDIKMTVATCVSANGKPPAVVTWDTELDGEANTEEIRNPDGTMTVRSDYIMTPSREAHEQRLTCISTYNNDQQTDSVILNVQYEPEVRIEGFDGNWYKNRENVQLTCLADANPAISTYQWRYLNGSMPNIAEQRGETLIFKGPVTYEMAGTYMCDATNSIGTGSASVEVIISESPSSTHAEQQRAGAAIGGAVVCGTVLLVAIILLVVFFHRQRRTFKGDYSTKKQVLANGFGKASDLSSCPSLPQSLTYPEDLNYPEDEKKPELYGGSSFLDERVQEFHNHPPNNIKPYSPAEDSKRLRYNEQNYRDGFGSELEVSVDMVPQKDGSVISKEEWAASSPSREKTSSFNQKAADDFQNQGQIYDELPNSADYVSYRLTCNKDSFSEKHSPPIQPPLTFLPQHPCPQSNTFSYPTPPGPSTSYTFPKEQYITNPGQVLYRENRISEVVGHEVTLECGPTLPNVYIWSFTKPGTETIRAVVYNFGKGPKLQQLAQDLGDLNIISNTASLFTRKLLLAAGGLYTCQALYDSTDGPRLYYYYIYLRVLVPVSNPHIRLSDSTAVEGSTFWMRCDVENGTEPIQYIWEQENRSGQVSILAKSNSSLITITSVNRNHTGWFRCLARNEVNQQGSDRIWLDILYGPDRPQISASSYSEAEKGYSVLEKETISLVCQATSKPPSQYVWIYNNSEIYSGPQLTITNILRVHAGNYTCLAQNTHSNNNAQETITLTVYYPPDGVPSCFIFSTNNYTDLAVLCSWEGGNPSANLNWSPYVNGQMSPGIASVTQIQPGPDIANNSVFTCFGSHVALNSTRTCSTRTWLPYGDPHCSANSSLNNEYLILSCSWDGGIPRASVWWASSSGDIQGLPEENSNILVLRSSTTYNGKSFVCHAKHPLIKESRKCVVTLGRPVLIPQQSVVSVFEGNDIQLTCMMGKTYPPPTKLMWYNNVKQNVGDQPKKYMVQQGPSWTNLTVRETDSKVDSGQYWCFASNALGGMEISILLLVMRYPTPPNVTISKIVYTRRYRTDVNVEWSLQEYGDVTGFIIERQKLSVPQERSDVVPVWETVTKNLKPSTRSYQISNLDPSTMYAFRVTPLNRRTVGYPSEIKIPVSTPVSKPYILLSDPSPVEGASLWLYCSLNDGTDPIYYTWEQESRSGLVTILSESNSSLINISSVTHNHTGWFRCLVKNEVNQQRSDRLWLDVIFGPDVPQIEVTPFSVTDQGYSALEKETVSLLCQASSNPPSQYVWFYNNSQVYTGPQLIITKILRMHSGYYACLAQNTYLNTYSKKTITLTVYYPPDGSPSCSIDPVNNYTGLALSCSWMGGYPSATVNWSPYLKKSDKLGLASITYIQPGPETANNSVFTCYGSHVALNVGQTCFTRTWLPYGEPKCSAYATRNNEYLMLSCSWEGGVPRALLWWNSSSGDTQGTSEENSNILVLRSSATYSGKAFVCYAKHPLVRESKQCVLKLEAPVLITQRSVVSVYEGNDVQLTCILSKNYPAVTEVTWYNNLKRNVGETPKKYVLEQAAAWFNLTVKETDSNVDSGQYWCSAANAVGGAEIPVLLQVMRYSMPPNVTISKITYNSQKRTEVILEWLIQRDGDLTGFFIERQRLPVDKSDDVPVWQKIIVDLDPSTRSYQITDLDPSGKYAFRVTAVNHRTTGHPSQVKSPGLEITDPGQVLYKEGRVSKVVGHEVTLECGPTLPDVYIWSFTKPGTEMIRAVVYNFGKGPKLQQLAQDLGDLNIISNTAALYIEKLPLTAQGLYTCQALYDTDEGAKLYYYYMFLQVLVPVSKPYILQSHLAAVEGLSFWMHCALENGTEPIHYTWEQENGSGQVGILAASNSELFNMTLVTRNHTGWFSCSARNEVNEQRSDRLWINVFYGPDLPQINGTTYSVTSQGCSVLEKTNISLMCQASSNPPSQYIWFYNNSEIHSGPQLTITDIQRAETGTYACLAQNTYLSTQSKKTITITVYYPPDGVPTCSIHPVNNYTDLALFCSWKGGYPSATLRWSPYLNNENRPSDTNVSQIQPGLETANNSVYTCYGSHVASKVTQTCSTRIWLPYGEPQCSVNSSHSNKHLTLSCSWEGGVPQALLWWASTSGEIQSTSTKSTHFLVLNFNATFNGQTFVCHAKHPLIRENKQCVIKLETPGLMTRSSVVSVYESYDVQLTCILSKNHLPVTEIAWYNNLKQNVGDAPRKYILQQDSLSFNLTVKETDSSVDSGQYWCSAANAVGQAGIPVSLLVMRHPMPPNVTISKLMYSGRRRTDVNMEWLIQMEANFTGFFIEYQRLPDSIGRSDVAPLWHKVAENLAPSTRKYQITDLDPTSKYVFRVTAVNHRTIGNSAEFASPVSVPVSKPYIILSDSSPLEGASVWIRCVLENGTDPVYYFWELESHSGLITKLAESNTSLINITLVTRNHTGWLRCLVQNEVNQQSGDQIWLDVIYGPDLPQINSDGFSDMEFLRVLEKGTVSLMCQASSNPPSQYIWFYNNSQVYTGPQLTITKIIRMQSGNYTCLAQNTHLNTYSKKTITLSVYWLPYGEPRCSANSSHNNENLILSCSWDGGFPQALLWWAFNSKETHGTSRLDTNILVLNASANYSGKTFICHAKHPLAKESKQCSLKMEAPVLMTQRNVVSVFEGSDALLTCVISKNYPVVPEITWFNNMKQNVLNNTKKYITQSGTGWSLIVRQTDGMIDNGQYWCSATNAVGVAEIPIMLLVIVPVSKPTLLLSNSSPVEGTSVSVRCVVEKGTEPISYTWELESQTGLIPNLTKENSSVVNVPRVSRNHTGWFRCLVRNEVNQQHSDRIFLNVLFGPDLPQIDVTAYSVTDMGYTALENSNISLMCQASSNPPSQYVWFYNNSQVYTGPQLTITKILRMQAGYYACLAQNANLNSRSKKTVTLAVYYPPDGAPSCYIYPINNYTDLALVCSWVGGFPPPRVNWSPYATEDNPQGLVNITRIQPGLKTLNNSVFTCYGSHVALKVPQNCSTRTWLPNGEPQCFAYVTRNNEYLMLSCSWEGGVPLALLWWASSSGDFQGSSEENSNILVLRSSANYSGKVFICHAKHPLATDSKQCVLKLEAPVLMTQRSVVSVYEGNDVQLTCILSKNYPAVTEITWYNNLKQDVGEIPKKYFLQQASTWFNLTIRETDSMADSGQYWCSATNAVGGAEIPVSLLVKRYPMPPNVTISKITYNSQKRTEVMLEWLIQRDGDLTGFFIERHRLPVGKSDVVPVWQKIIVDLDPSTRRYQITDLDPKGKYAFRVTAVNHRTTGHPSQVKSPGLEIVDPGQVIYRETRTNGVVDKGVILECGPTLPDVYIWSFTKPGTDTIRAVVYNFGKGPKLQQLAKELGDLNVISNSASLSITTLPLAAEGLYTCQALYDTAEGAKFYYYYVYLRVLVPVSKPYILLSDSSPVEGASVWMRCGLENGTGPVHYVWEQENHIGHVNIMTESDSDLINITSVSRNHTGWYRCLARNEVNQQSGDRIWLDVIFGPDVPQIDVTPYSVTDRGYSALERETVSLLCQASSNPPSQYVWFYNNSQVYTGPQLTITKILRMHTGYYACLAQNTYLNTRSKKTINLSVYWLPNKEPQCFAYATHNNEYLMLSCSWEGGFPRALLWWDSSSGDVQGTSEENSNILVLRSSATYSGKAFVCHAKHPLVKDSKQCVLKLEAPVLMTQRSVVTVYEGNDVQLTCILSQNYPAVTEITWYNNMKQKVGDSGTPKKYVLQQAAAWSNLTVRETDGMEDGGQYWCSATNAVGGAEIPIMLVVLRYPMPPNVTISKIVYSSRQRTDVNVEWMILSEDDYTGFFIERQNLPFPLWQKVVGDVDPSTRSFQITNLDPSGTYAFRITAVNHRTFGHPSEVKSPALPGFNAYPAVIGAAIGGMLVATIATVLLFMYVVRNRNNNPRKQNSQSRENINSPEDEGGEVSEADGGGGETISGPSVVLPRPTATPTNLPPGDEPVNVTITVMASS